MSFTYGCGLRKKILKSGMAGIVSFKNENIEYIATTKTRRANTVQNSFLIKPYLFFSVIFPPRLPL